MAWLSITDFGDGVTPGHEYISEHEPVPTQSGRFKYHKNRENTVQLPQGSIEKLIGRKITWEEGPVWIE